MHTLGALLCLRRPLCYLRSVHWNGKESQGWLSIGGEWNAHTMSQQEARAMKVGLCRRVASLHTVAASLSYDNEHALKLICYKYCLPRWSLGKYYTLTFLCKKCFCTVSQIIYPPSAAIGLFYVQRLLAHTTCVQIYFILQHPSLMLGSGASLGSLRHTQLTHRMPPGTQNACVNSNSTQASHWALTCR